MHVYLLALEIIQNDFDKASSDDSIFHKVSLIIWACLTTLGDATI